MSNEVSQLYCPIRKLWVAALPEEVIRQKLVLQMIQQLGFPESCLVLEKGLSQMPHLALSGKEIPKRRADLICFSKGIHPYHDLYPLLLIECKAVKLTHKVINQVAGYNHFLQAYFIAIANEDEIKTGWYDAQSKDYVFVDYLPSYQQLCQRVLNQG